jgi:N-methylhydantoinase A
MAQQRKYILATDVGGTCTDTVVLATGEPVRLGKTLSTPPDFAQGVIDSIGSAAKSMDLSVRELLAKTQLFFHGSTVVDNTVLTHSGAKTGLLTTLGFEDTLLVTRGAYGRWGGLTEDEIKHPIATDRGPPLVPFELIRGVPERVDWKGAVVYELDEDVVEQALRYLLKDQGVEAIAVTFLWSFFNPSHERKVRKIIKRVSPETYVSLSSDIAPAPGEYERTSTTVINSYAGRIARDYIQNLQALLAREGYAGPLLVMQGYGGLLPAAEAAERAVGMLECGPAAGVIGSQFLGEIMGDRDVIAADMGGTTFKVGVIQDGELEYAREPMVDRYHYVAPKIEVVSIGAGGGSIVSLDPKTGLPRVGPQSAGARPGPVCYGRGGAEPTLTDVFALVGYMDPKTFLGGTMTLDVNAARRAFKSKIADPLGRSVEDAAAGIYRVAAAQIYDLIHRITVERGLDPRDFVLHAFGGACGQLCAMFGAELNVKRIVVPYTASVNASFGLISADIVHEYSSTAVLPMPCPPKDINKLYAPMVERAKKQLKEEGFTDDRIKLDWAIDLRYGRQVHEVTTPVRGRTPMDEAAVKALGDDFEALYERKYGKGSAYRQAGMEMRMFRLTARGLMERPKLDRLAVNGVDPDAARIGRRDIFVDARDGFAPADIYDFERLRPGNVVKGPAVIHTPITTIVVQDRQAARMDEYRNMVLELR